jgi:hypothetical protein
MQDADPQNDIVEVINLARQLANRIGSTLLRDQVRRTLQSPASRHPQLSQAFFSQKVRPVKLRHPHN